MTAGVTVWLDPGKLTGIAAWYHDREEFTSVQADFKGTGEWLELLAAYTPAATPPSYRFINDLYYPACNITEPSEICIGWEQYVVTPGNTRHGTAYYSLEVIGMARWIATKHDLTILQPQMSAMMAIATDERLKLLGWYKAGKPHANDAARHLLRYCIKEDALPEHLKQKIFAESLEP